MRRSVSFAFVIVAVLAAVVLVACGTPSQPASGAGEGAAKKTKAKTKAPTKATAADESDDEAADDETDEPTPTKAAAAPDDEGDDEPAAPAAGSGAANTADEGEAPDDLLERPARPRGDRVHIAQILIRFRGAERAPDEITRSRDEARTLARQIVTEARSGDFAAIARQRSEDDASRAGGGDLGEVERGTMPEALDRAAFALAAGAVSDVVETEFGFHVLKRLP